MGRKKILWLASWYPNQTDAFTGDFIQRHAIAAALYNDIHIIHVQPVPKASITGSVKEEIIKKEGLTEQIIYFKRPAHFFSKTRTFLKWLKLFRTAVRQYMNDYGKP